MKFPRRGFLFYFLIGEVLSSGIYAKLDSASGLTSSFVRGDSSAHTPIGFQLSKDAPSRHREEGEMRGCRGCRRVVKEGDEISSKRVRHRSPPSKKGKEPGKRRMSPRFSRVRERLITFPRPCALARSIYCRKPEGSAPFSHVLPRVRPKGFAKFATWTRRGHDSEATSEN